MLNEAVIVLGVDADEPKFTLKSSPWIKAPLDDMVVSTGVVVQGTNVPRFDPSDTWTNAVPVSVLQYIDTTVKACKAFM